MAGDFDSSLPVRTVSVEELQVQTKVGTNLNTDLKKINGTTVSVNTGTVDSGTQRVTLASDQAPVTVIQPTGTNLHVNVDNFPADADALAQGSTTSGQTGSLSMGATTTAAPTYTTATTNPLSLTTTGALRVDGSGSTQPVSGTIALDAPTLAALESITVQNGAGASAVNIQDGGNSITVDGTIAATQSGTWNINNISGTISLPTGASTLAEQQTQTTSLQLIDDLPLTQGSTTSGEKGILNMGAVTTSAPSYTTGQTSPLSLTTSGALRVSVVSAAADSVNVFDQNTSADIASNATSTHTYTPGTDFFLTDVIGSASGKFKIEIQTGTTGSETTKVVLFTQGERQAVWHLSEPLKVLTTQSVKIIRTNLDNQAQPLYSTVQGYL